MPPTPRLAYAPPLGPGEPLDGWLEHIANTLNATVADIAQLCGIPVRRTAYHFVRDLTDQDFAQLATQTGQPADILEAATLKRWQHCGLLPPRQQAGYQRGPWQRGSGARFCPDCFTERDGRWKLAWYLQWSFACTQHQRLLIPTCACGTTPRTSGRWRRDFTTARIDTCHECHRQLTDDSASIYSLDDEHPLIRAQQRIDSVLDASDREPTVAGTPVDPHTWFSDLTALTRATITVVAQNGQREVPASLVEVEDQHAVQAVLTGIDIPVGHGGTKHFAAATAEPALLGACATVAIDMLESVDRDELLTKLDSIPPLHEERFLRLARAYAASSTLIGSLGGRSLTTRTLAAFKEEHRRLSPATGALIRPCHLPGRAFPSLTARHPQFLDLELPAAAATVALLVWPNLGSLKTGADLLGHTPLRRPIATEWARLLEADPEQTILRDLLALRAILVSDGNPIDYDRRRHTYATPKVLASRIVRPVANELDVPLTRAFIHTVSLYVHEQLSGADALLTLEGLTLPGAFRLRFRRVRRAWDTHPPNAVLNIIEAALLRHRINEPVRWQPTHDGTTWTHPEPDYTRTLKGWETRALRQASRFRTPGQLRHATLEQIVEFAYKDSSDYAGNVRTWLEDLARLAPDPYRHGLKSIGARKAAALLARHTDRDLVTRHTPNGWHPEPLTPAGHTLVQIVRSHPDYQHGATT